MSPDDFGAGAEASAERVAAFAIEEPQAAARYRAVRARSVALAAPLSPEDATAQSMPDASPVKWHLAHTTWFFETFILRPRTGAEPFDPAFCVLFNSYYEAIGARTPRAERGLITRPGLKAVMAYRAHVDAAMEHLLIGGLDEAGAGLVALGLAHEEQHQELILTDLLHLFSRNPTHPAYAATAPRAAPAPPRLTWTDHAGGIVAIGAADATFAFDNESPRHAALLQPHRLANRLVTNGEWLHFMREGGYRRPDLWLSDGWAAVRTLGWTAPEYWSEDAAGAWFAFGLHGLRPVDPFSPVGHVSHYEADAYARWAGARLPSEFEWEAAAAATAADGPRQMFGSAWQWTGSAYLPYPGFAPEPGAVGEYNGKFMSGQMVLRGGSAATASGHSRPTYRNFFPPAARWQFTGVRLAADPSKAEDGEGGLLADALAGLRKPRKSLPSKHLYDAEGSRLFEAITTLEEYYPTRTETALLARAAPKIAALAQDVGASAGVLVEFGSGASVKTRILLDALPRLHAYAFIDISASALAGASGALAQDRPHLALCPIEGDFTRPAPLPESLAGLPRIGFFPGSTIGNFAPEDAETFLVQARATLGQGALFLVGVDLVKDPAVLERAYDDAAGVTAAFDLNILARLNRELGSDFDLTAFAHRAVWDGVESRMEMRLQSLCDQVAHIAGETIGFVKGETIHTESSYKYRLDDFSALAKRAGWRTVERWISPEPFGFCLALLQA